uniref:Replication factor A protein 3 n=1 Tax=Ditylum brightwellii TaxID=49249 RepID=A0A6U3S6E2_9STRA|mmetsp:Transcript_21541/g.28350  ORF Transcript_21541/g.28350 Transcript_21541/m.28350 type:complete len:116 (-) Transcript_21541:459-806(-)
MSQQQEDGEYPRLNSKMIQTDHSHIGSIISVIGSVVSNDGSVVTLRCADGGNARIAVDPSFDTQAGSVVEIVGLLESDRSVQHFVTREIGSDFDMEVYNSMLVDVHHNPKFAEYF